MEIQNIPKIELHLHLEGAAPPDFIKKLGLIFMIELKFNSSFEENTYAQVLTPVPPLG